MALTTSFSSDATGRLLAWRNPQGRDEDFYNLPDRIDNYPSFLGKIVVTEIGLCLITASAAVETVANASLMLVSIVFLPISTRPFVFFAKHLDSSSFTMIWAIADALFYNLFYVNVTTRESFARFWADMFVPIFSRLEDEVFIAEWHRRIGRHGDNVENNIAYNPMMGPIINQGRITQNLIDQGATFLSQEVFAGSSPETLNLFKMFDESVYLYGLTKAVYIYVAGNRKNDAIPNFFKRETREQIATLRRDLNDESVLRQLNDALSSPTQFNQTLSSEPGKAAMVRLRNIAWGESQRSLFCTRCWQKASEAIA